MGCHGFMNFFGVEEPIERDGCDVYEVGHWLSLSVEVHQSVPGNTVVKELAVGDDVLRRVRGNKEGALGLLQYQLVSEGGMCGWKEGPYTKHNLTFSKY